MPLDFKAAIEKKYKIAPVPKTYVESNKTAKPQILWVGCSDSVISETETLAVDAEEIFVHRNLGNILSNGDLSSESAIEWCLDVLKVDHIVICGHYDCALIRERDEHRWVRDITKLHTLDEEHLRKDEGMTDKHKIEHRLEEIYVLAEVEWLKRQQNVREAVQERGLQIHAFVYDKDNNQCSRLIEVTGNGT